MLTPVSCFLLVPPVPPPWHPVWFPTDNITFSQFGIRVVLVGPTPLLHMFMLRCPCTLTIPGGFYLLIYQDNKAICYLCTCKVLAEHLVAVVSDAGFFLQPAGDQAGGDRMPVNDTQLIIQCSVQLISSSVVLLLLWHTFNCDLQGNSSVGLLSWILEEAVDFISKIITRMSCKAASRGGQEVGLLR